MDKEQEELELEVEELLRKEYGASQPNRKSKKEPSVFVEVKEEQPSSKKETVFNHSYNGPKVQLYEPLSYEDAKMIATSLFNQQVVIVKLTQLSTMQANRLIDFLTGVVYGIDGDIARIASESFICTPEQIELSEELLNRFNKELY